MPLQYRPRFWKNFLGYTPRHDDDGALCKVIEDDERLGLKSIVLVVLDTEAAFLYFYPHI